MITTLTSIVNTLVATGVVDFPANYKITNKDHVFVYYVDGEEAEVLLVQVTSFTAGSPNEYKVNAITESGFNVELRDAYDTSDGRKISTRRVLPLTQEVDYPPGNDFPAATHERALDKLTAIVQQFSEQIERQIGMPLSEDSTETNLPSFIPNAYLGLDGSNDFVWKDGTGAPGSDEIKASHIDWGTGADQVKASDMPIEDAGGIITATEVEGALQENRTDLDIEEAALVAHKAADGKEHSDVVANTLNLATHEANNGSDHSYINQDVKNTASPDFVNGNYTGNLNVSGLTKWKKYYKISTTTRDVIYTELITWVPNVGDIRAVHGHILDINFDPNGAIIVGLYRSTTDNIEFLLILSTGVSAKDDYLNVHNAAVAELEIMSNFDTIT